MFVIFFTSRAGFPQLSGQGSWGMKSTPQKGTSAGSLSRQKSVGGKPSERLLSSSPASMQSSLKGKKDAMSKQSGMCISVAVVFVEDISIYFLF